MEMATAWCSPRASPVTRVTGMGHWWWIEVVTVDSWCAAIRDIERQSWMKKRVVGEMGEVRLPFIEAEEQGSGRLEELDGGQWVGFEVGHFEGEGDTAWHRFNGEKDGGWVALYSIFIQTWEGKQRRHDDARTGGGGAVD
jgi:hypothetical protein